MDSTLTLRYDFNAVCELAERGINLIDGGLTPEVLKNPANVLLFVWAGLLLDHPELELKDVKSHIKGIRPKEVFDAVTDAVTRDLANNDAAGAAS